MLTSSQRAHKLTHLLQSPVSIANIIRSSNYIPCAALHELRELLASTSPVRAGAPRTSLRDALEALTGMQGCHWKEIEGLAPEDGLELEIPVLQQALRDRSDFTMNEWHQMNVWGLQSRHYVRVGNRIMKPQRQRNHKLAKWLKNAGWRIDMTSMDNMFATVNAHRPCRHMEPPPRQ